MKPTDLLRKAYREFQNGGVSAVIDKAKGKLAAPKSNASLSTMAATESFISRALRTKIDSQILREEALIGRIRDVLLESYYSHMTWWQPGYLDFSLIPPELQKKIDDHTYRRYNTCLESVLPWILSNIDLSDADVVEIGCGTGSSASAISRFCKSITGFDIDSKSVQAAIARAEVLELKNTRFFAVQPQALIDLMEEQCPKPSVILIYAVLEHQTIDERLETLARCWEMLEPAGKLIIVETPNRLSYFDRHTSLMPFFHMLPLEIQRRYYDRSPRRDFVDNIAYHKERVSDDELSTLLVRWGQSVSFHDLEIALQEDLNKVTICDGLSPFLAKVRPETRENEILKNYFDLRNINLPKGYANYYLDLILQKKG